MISQSGQVQAAFLALAAGLALVGCAEVPQLDETITPVLDAADYPALVPIETLLVPLPPPAQRSEELKSDIEARRDRLQERASRLNQAPVVDDETETRMQAGVQG
jgi:hypothetical protein